jgi:hypothetical protein
VVLSADVRAVGVIQVSMVGEKVFLVDFRKLGVCIITKVC